MARLVVFLAVTALCGSLLESAGGADEFLLLGQSPSGPLLDDGESGTWLDDGTPSLLSDEVDSNRPISGGSGVADSQASTKPADADGGSFFDQNGVAGPLWQGSGYGNGLDNPGHMMTCPACGSPLPLESLGCASCAAYPPGLLGSVPGIRALAAGGPIAHDLLQPYTRESWLFRPFSAGWFMGFMQGNELVDDWVGQEQGFFGGYRLGWDFDPYWGCEMRFGFASVALYDSQRAKAAQQAADLADGLTPDDPYYHRFDTRRDSRVRLWDVEMLWYPYGDTPLRPYFLLGLGAARVDFMDRLSDRRIKSVFAMPIALGVKYRVRRWLALRLEATDNFIAGAGSGFKNLHNFSLTAGMEVRFGGTRTAYWPHNPGRHYW